MNATMANTQRLTDLEYAKYNTGREQWDAQHQMDLEKQQASLTGYINGLPTFEREQWDANNKLATANLIASLSGPASAFKQVAVIRSLTGVEPTVSGVTDSIRSVLQGNGQTVAAYGQGTGGAPPANPYSPYYTQQPGGTSEQGTTPPASTGQPNYQTQVMPYSIAPSGVQADPAQWNYEATPTGGTNIYPPGVVPPYTAPQASTDMAVDPQTQKGLAQQAQQVNAAAPAMNTTITNTAAPPYVAPTATSTNGLLPSQINAKNFNNMTDYEKQMVWAGFGDAQFGSGAYDPALAKQLYEKSLPQYAAPKTGNIVL